MEYTVEVNIREDGEAKIHRRFETNDARVQIEDGSPGDGIPSKREVRVRELDAAIALLEAEQAKYITVEDQGAQPDVHSADTPG